MREVIEALPIRSWEEPLIINGKRYFVIGTGTDEDGCCVDTLKSESTGVIKTFKRSAVMRSIDRKAHGAKAQEDAPKKENKKNLQKNCLNKNKNPTLF